MSDKLKLKLKLLLTAACIGAIVVCCVFMGRSYLRVWKIEGERMEISAASGVLETRLREVDAKASEEKKRLEEAKKQPKFYTHEAFEKMVSEDPVLQNKRLAAIRAGALMAYGLFFQKMHLTEEQRSRFTDALVQRQADMEDLNAILMDAGQTPAKADSAWRKANQDSIDAFENTAMSVLGEEGRAQLEIYDQDIVMWNDVGALAAVAARSGIPISLQQADKLVALMSNAPSTPKPEAVDLSNLEFGTPSGPGSARMPQAPADWAAIDEQAKTFLSEKQMNLFRSAAPWRSHAQLSWEMEQAATGADSNSDSGSP